MEVVVAIAILGVTATSIFAAMVSGIGGSARHREHATATAWLQSAADVLEVSPMENCASQTAAQIALTYQQDIHASLDNSDGWTDSRLTVTGVQFWNGGAFGATCSDDVQLVSMSVTSPNGEVTQTLDVVKGPPLVELSNLPIATDSFSSCAVSSFTMTSPKSGVVAASGNKWVVTLKKPSTTKPSQVKDDKITLTLVTQNVCPGKLRITYRWPHYDGKGNFKHWHNRKINLKLLKGTTNTYVGKWGHHGDKWLDGASVDLTIEQGRAKSKTWGAITGGVMVGEVEFT